MKSGGHKMSWLEGWKQVEKPVSAKTSAILMNEAKQMVTLADTRENVIKLIQLYEHILKSDPSNSECLMSLYSFCFLCGYGYAQNQEEKKVYFLKAIKYSEQFMYTHPDFKRLADNGEKVWQACRVLSTREIEAMSYWYLAVGSYWKDCQNAWGKLVNIVWPLRIKQILTRMMEIDPTWLNGTPYYFWANYYAAAPKLLGGNLKKAEEYYKKAIELGPNMLNYRRTRAYFLHTKKKDKASFKEDLEWVIAQDPYRAGLSYPWNAYIQRDAKNGLANMDSFFQ